MKTKSFVCGAKQHMRSFAVHLIVCIFIGGFFAVFAGGFDGFAAVVWLAAMGCGVWEFLSAVSIDVTSDAVIYRKSGKEPVRYPFSDFYISPSSDGTSLIAEHRRNGKTETIKCTAFEKATISDAAAYIRSASGAYYMSRRSSEAPSAKDSSPENGLKRAAESAAEASKRNPYSKNYAGNAVPKPDKVVTEVKAPSVPSSAKPSDPAERQMTEPLNRMDSTSGHTSTPVKTVGNIRPEPAPKQEPAAKTAPTEKPVAPELSNDIPKDYNKLPEIGKIPEADYRSLPEITVPTFDSTLPDENAAPKPSKHDHGEDFHKIVFYYPKRAISERIERSNALFVLWTLFFAVLAFLGAYIALGALTALPDAGISVPGYFTAVLAGVIALIAVVIIAFRVVSGAAVTSRIFSKLEITDHHLVIDNVRFRFDRMSEMTMTAPALSSGRRHLAYRSDGKSFDYDLGPAVKPSGKRSDEFFTRYDDLWHELSARGFRAV